MDTSSVKRYVGQYYPFLLFFCLDAIDASGDGNQWG